MPPVALTPAAPFGKFERVSSSFTRDEDEDEVLFLLMLFRLYILCPELDCCVGGGSTNISFADLTLSENLPLLLSKGNLGEAPCPGMLGGAVIVSRLTLPKKEERFLWC